MRTVKLQAFPTVAASPPDWCLAAPGEDILTAYFGPREGVDGFRGLRATVNGTSFAAPMVTGGLAVMKHLFRDQLSNTDLLARLLATADSTGRYSDRSIYGQGMMDLGAATSPVGVMTVTTGEYGEHAGQPPADEPGPARDGFRGTGSPGPCSATNSRHSMRWVRPSGLTWGILAATPRGPGNGQCGFATSWRLSPLLKALRRWMTVSSTGTGRAGSGLPGRMSLGLLEMPMGAGASHFALAEHALALTYTAANGMSATAFTTEGVYGETPASGAEFSWRPSGSGLGLRAGWLG